MMRIRNIMLLLMALPIFSIAQVTEPGDLPSDEIDVIKDYEPVLANPVRVSLNPTIEDIKRDSIPDLDYNLIAKEPDFDYVDPNIKPIAYREELEKLQNFYFKAGLGNHVLPLVRGVYNSGRNTRGSYGLEFNHLTMTGGTENQSLNLSDVGVFGKYFFKGQQLGARVRYENNNYHQYGYDNADTSFTSREVKRKYQNITADIGFRNLEENRIGLNYNTDVGLNYLFNDSVAEVEADVVVGFNKNWDEKYHVGIDVEFDIVNLSKPYNYNAILIGGKPYVRFTERGWVIDLGLRIKYDGGNDEFTLMQDLYFERNLIEEKAVFFIGWEKDHDINSYHRFSEINYFIADSIKLMNSTSSDLFFGVKGMLGRRFAYNARFGQLTVKDMPFFINDSTNMKEMLVVYDSSASILNMEVGLVYLYSGNLRIEIGARLRSYKLDDLARPFHKPDLDVNLSGRYKLAKKFSLETQLYYLGKQAALDENNQIVNLPAGFDANMALEYHYNKYFTLYVEGNNLTNQKYQRWYQYPNYGFSIFGGLILNF